MNEPNYTYFEIDTADIWEYERNLVIAGKANLELSRKILEKIESLLIQHVEPSFSADLYDSGSEKEKSYYSRKVREYRESLSSIEELYRNEIFFCKNDCYSFGATLVLEPSDGEYEFFFIQKLRQYDVRISAIAEFLDFQLENNYNENPAQFLRFLKLCLRQYPDLLTARVIETTQEWIDDRSQQVPAQTSGTVLQMQNEYTLPVKRSALVINPDSPPAHSFTLKSYIQDPDYFVKNANEFVEVFQALKKEFIHRDTKLDQFRNILSNKKIKPEDRIEWIGSLMELSMFVRLLHNDLEKILPIEKGVWSIAVSCFMKEGQDIKESQLSKANGSTRNRELLSTLLQRL